MSDRPKSAIRLLDTDGVDKGDWIWCIGSKAVPHRHGAYDEIITFLNGQTIRVMVSRKRKKIHVTVNGEEWKP